MSNRFISLSESDKALAFMQTAGRVQLPPNVVENLTFPQP